jgi:hypothetical protein
MPITPTTLIATTGLVNGQGIQVSPEMISTLDAASTNALVTNLNTLATTTASSLPGLTAVLNTLPAFLANIPTLAGNITTQANAILPPSSGSDPSSSIKSFLNLHSQAAGGAGIMAEISAALSEFSPKAFTDLGINSTGFHDVVTQSVTSATPALNALASQASNLPLGSLGSIPGLPNPSSLLSGAGSLAAGLGGLLAQASSSISTGIGATSTSGLSSLLGKAVSTGTSALGDLGNRLKAASPSISAGDGATMGGINPFGTKGTSELPSPSDASAQATPTSQDTGAAQLKSDTLNVGLSNAGAGLQSFGTLFDFTDLPLNAMNMLKSLQSNGLAGSTGINDLIKTAGFDPKGTVPDGTLQQVFGSITGSDLQKIIDQTGAQITGPVNSLSDLLNPANIMPPEALAALGIGDGAGGLDTLTNTFMNLGIQADNFQAGAYLASMKTVPTPNLDQLTQPIPDFIATDLKPMLGSGGGLFGNPTMMDMIGTLGGAVHTDSFKAINSTLENIMNSTEGTALNAAAQTLISSPTTPNLTAFQTAVNNFNASANLSTSLSTANTAFAASKAQLQKEQQNLSLIGVSLFSSNGAPAPQSNSGGVVSIFNLGSKLHDFGVDKQQLGHNELFNAIATDDLTGDAIKASLLEGRNLAKSYAIGKSTPTVANEQAQIAASSSGTSA